MTKPKTIYPVSVTYPTKQKDGTEIIQSVPFCEWMKMQTNVKWLKNK